MSRIPDDAEFMRHAIDLARRAAEEGEVPVGAVVVQDGAIIGVGWNRPIASSDPTAHAEIVAIRASAAQLANYRLSSATLYVTLEPCAMCIGAVINARLPRLVFGAWDLKAGACGSVLDLPRERKLTHRVDVFGGVLSEECGGILKAFFAARR